MIEDTVLEAYLKSDRQWPRYCRIAHAEYQLKNSQSDSDRVFWQAVIDANKDDEHDKSK